MYAWQSRAPLPITRFAVPLRSKQPLAIPLDAGRPPVASPARARAISIISGMLGVPLMVLAAMVVLRVYDKHPAATPGQQIELSTASGSATAIVYGAGTGIHIRHISAGREPIVADLSLGDLHAISLATLRIDAVSVGGRRMDMSGRGHAVALRVYGRGAGVSTWF